MWILRFGEDMGIRNFQHGLYLSLIKYFNQVFQGKFKIVLSDVTLAELQRAPLLIRQLPARLPPDFLELVTITEEQLTLADHYINEGALSLKFHTDAQHIAIATILKVDGLISWNFKHMVNFFRIRQYNSINLKFGYSPIDIRAPNEIVYGEQD